MRQMKDGTMDTLPPDSAPKFPSSQPIEPLMPTPLVTAGIGLILSILFPGGLTGGQGFLVGLVIGLALSVLLPVLKSALNPPLERCPHCGAALTGPDQTQSNAAPSDVTPQGSIHG